MCTTDAEHFSDYCVGNLELIVIIKIVFLNNQKGSFDITHTGQTSKKNHCSQTNPEFKILNFGSHK